MTTTEVTRLDGGPPGSTIEQPSAVPGGPATTVVITAPSTTVASVVTEETVPGGDGPTPTEPPLGAIDFSD